MLVESRRKRSVSKASLISRTDSMSSDETHLSDLVDPDADSLLDEDSDNDADYRSKKRTYRGKHKKVADDSSVAKCLKGMHSHVELCK